MFIINNPLAHDIMNPTNQINFNNINQTIQPLQRKCQKNNIKSQGKPANNKNLTFSSIEQFLHYKMTGRKPHPKVKFTPQEDELLRNLVSEYGENDNWSIIAKKMTITYRNQRQCKERWFNYLSPNINNTPLTREEDEKLEDLYAKYGAKWVQIAKYFPSRTDINIRSRWLVLQRRKKKLETKQSDESETSPISSNLTENQQNLNLPLPQISPNEPSQQQSMNNQSINNNSNFADDIQIQNSIEFDSSQLINDNSSTLYGNIFSFDDEKDIFNEENLFNLTPVELTTNDMSNFDNWSF